MLTSLDRCSVASHRNRFRLAGIGNGAWIVLVYLELFLASAATHEGRGEHYEQWDPLFHDHCTARYRNVRNVPRLSEPRNCRKSSRLAWLSVMIVYAQPASHLRVAPDPEQRLM